VISGPHPEPASSYLLWRPNRPRPAGWRPAGPHAHADTLSAVSGNTPTSTPSQLRRAPTNRCTTMMAPSPDTRHCENHLAGVRSADNGQVMYGRSRSAWRQLAPGPIRPCRRRRRLWESTNNERPDLAHSCAMRPPVTATSVLVTPEGREGGVGEARSSPHHPRASSASHHPRCPPGGAASSADPRGELALADFARHRRSLPAGAYLSALQRQLGRGRSSVLCCSLQGFALVGAGH
jgi:hypothetical protein